MQSQYIFETRSLYIHWPFCPYRCHFCPFVALAGQDHLMESYHKALKNEIELFAKGYQEKQVIDTIYFGGGTPSTYPDDLLLDTFSTLRKRFIISEETEITLEVNPGTVREEQFPLWKMIGINRMSIGVQSLNDGVLKNLNRHQKATDVQALLDKAQHCVDSISVDLILGLPGVSPEEWKATLAKVVTWPIKHLSMYFLMVHENTLLYFRIKKRDVMLPKDDAVVDLYYWSVNFLAEHGFVQYEVSSFAKPGYESRHNQVYWGRKPYRGFGLGAHSFDGIGRFSNEKNIVNYTEGVQNGGDIVTFSETLSEKQVYLEKIMLGIRQIKGVPLADVLSGLSSEEKKYLGKKISTLKQQGFLCERNGNLCLTPVGLSVENRVALSLSL